MSHTPTTEGEFEMVVYDEAKVLVLYSGGTIGMLATDKGYVPEKGYLTVSQISPVPASRLTAPHPRDSDICELKLVSTIPQENL